MNITTTVEPIRGITTTPCDMVGEGGMKRECSLCVERVVSGSAVHCAWWDGDGLVVGPLMRGKAA